MNKSTKTLLPIARRLGLVALTASLIACENPAEENADDISALRSVLVEQAEALDVLAEKNAQLQMALNDQAAAMDALQNQVNTIGATYATSADVQENAARIDGNLDDIIALETIGTDASALLAYVQVDPAQNTVAFVGANVFIQSGSGMTTDDGELTGLGNLIIGYNEDVGEDNARSGSHNLVVGAEHSYSNVGGFVAGFYNTISGPYASVTAGAYNEASGERSSVSGGMQNEAGESYASVSGGKENMATGPYAAVSGGLSNQASGSYASVTGGFDNVASYYYSSVTGGHTNTASGSYSTVSGGLKNKAGNTYASVTGGSENEATGYYSSVTGGNKNTASYNWASVSGGANGVASGTYSSVTGGDGEVAKYGHTYAP